jgi:hypothetical protein
MGHDPFLFSPEWLGEKTFRSRRLFAAVMAAIACFYTKTPPRQSAAGEETGRARLLFLF